MVDCIGSLTVNEVWAGQVSSRGNQAFLTYETQAGARYTATYQDFEREVNRTANLLVSAKCGVKKGDNVVVQLANCPEFLICQLALSKIGAVLVPINAEYLREECEYIIKLCHAKLAIVDSNWLYLYEEMPEIETLMSVEHLLLGQQAEPTMKTYPSSISLDEDRKAYPATFESNPAIKSEDTAMLLFTSGTTDSPKGVVITQANCVFAGMYGCWQMAMTEQDKFLTPMPMYHSAFQLAALMPVIFAGAQLIVESRYSARRFWEEVRRNEATLVQAVSMMLRAMLVQPTQADERQHHVRQVLYYLPLSLESRQVFEERFAVSLLNSYGSTESICWVITDFPFGPRKHPSIGRVGLGYEAKIVDNVGNELAPDTIGEILIKGEPGRTLMKEYYARPAETAATIDNEGWLHTGDLGKVDSEGWFYFVERHEEVIKRSGENISSPEVERILLEIPAIAEVAVVGVPDTIRDEAVKAYIVLKAGEVINEASIKAYCEGHLARFKVPTIYEFVAALPHTSTGKIVKHHLEKTCLTTNERRTK